MWKGTAPKWEPRQWNEFVLTSFQRKKKSALGSSCCWLRPAHSTLVALKEMNPLRTSERGKLDDEKRGETIVAQQPVRGRGRMVRLGCPSCNARSRIARVHVSMTVLVVLQDYHAARRRFR